MGEVALGLHHPDRAGRARDGTGPAPVLDRARQRLVRRHEDDVDRRAHHLPLHDRHVGALQPAAAVEDPQRVDPAEAARARRRARHRPLAVGRIRPPCRWRSGCGSSATTTCSSSRRWRCSRAGALARGSRKWATRTVAFAVVVGLLFSAAGYVYRPGVPEPNYETVSRYLATTTNPDDPIYVWGSVPEIYWASERSSRRRGSSRRRSSPATTRAARRQDANTGDDTEAAWERLLRGLHGAPAEVLRRHVTGEGARRAVLPDLRVPPARAHRRVAVPLRRHHRRHRRVQAQVAAAL